MQIRIPAAIALTLGLALATPAAAANKEHQQLAADIRMLQEQAAQLQAMLASITDAIKAVNTRLDEQNNAVRKSFADQKLIIDTLSNDLRVVREKVDDNNVRISSLTQELDALRQAMQQMASRPMTSDAAAGAAPGGPPPEAGTTGAPAQPGTQATSGPPGPPPQLATSPQHLFEIAYSDYASGQWDLAIQGFESYIRTFPKSDQADNAQVNIGTSYMMAGNYAKAVESYDAAIRDYPTGDAIPDAYYRRGLALRHLGQLDKARDSLEFVVKNYPETDAGRLAKQQLDQIRKP